jgi:iron(III) transport system substrate-binding protein
MNTDKFKLVLSYLCSSVFICGSILLPGCGKSDEVVLYTSVDEPYARPIVQQFENETGIKVRLVTDTEASKSVGLAERLRAEAANPRCDVWWGNEPFHTIQLADEGLLQAYDSPAAADVNPMYRDPQHKWAGNGLRARVLVISSWEAATVVGDGIRGATAPRLKGKVAMALPTAGTTGGHIAALYVLWGESQTDEFLRQLHDNDIQLLGGNGPVADAVGHGQMLLGFTDNDDADSSIREGGKLSRILPDQNGQGTLMIPTTIGLVSGSKQSAAAKKLIDFLLSSKVEQKLIEVKFAGWSVRTASDVKAMQIDYHQVARIMPQAIRRATAILQGRE